MPSGPDAVDDPFLAPVGADLSVREQRYVEASMAANTLRGYRADWRDFRAFCEDQGASPLPAADQTVSQYIVFMADAGANVGTISRRLSAIRAAHVAQDLSDPTKGGRVQQVWQGIRRELPRRAEQAKPLMPPELFTTVDAARARPAPRRGSGVPGGPNLRSLRDPALLLVGFYGALRRSELASIEVSYLSEDPDGLGLLLRLPRSKTNQEGTKPDEIPLPRAVDPERCPVVALERWLTAARISKGPVFRKVTTGNTVVDRALSPAAVNGIITGSMKRAGLEVEGFSGHSLRAGFVTYCTGQGLATEWIAQQTRHRSAQNLAGYHRRQTAWEHNAVTELGF